MIGQEFAEVAHSGGQIIIRFFTTPTGQRAYGLEWRHNRPVGGGIFAVYALSPGIAIAEVHLGGLGAPNSPAPTPGAILVFIASDSEGMFGRQCPSCDRYWRSKAVSPFCAYCSLQAPSFAFMTNAQGAYVQQYCTLFSKGFSSGNDGDYVIDLDAVADAVRAIEKPPFYYAEETQQNSFACRECDTANDILGRFGYCTLCGTRNDLQELETKILVDIRRRINVDGTYESCVKEIVSAFDTFISQYVKEVLRRVPMSTSRKNRLDGRRFHNLISVDIDLRETLDWRILQGISEEDRAFAILMFYRRHVYEHNGGEVDQHYLDESGDKDVRLKQTLRETQESAHRIAGIVLKMARNVHGAFHELLPGDEKYIRQHKRP